MNASDVEAFLWDLSAPDAGFEEITPPVIDKDEDVHFDDTARLPSGKRLKLQKCLDLKRQRPQAARVLQEAKPAASAEALGGSGGACPLADEAAPRLSQPACTAACRSPDGDSDLEAEQRVNAEMKERYWRLAERAALELVSDGEEEEEDNMPPPSPRSVERRAASESAQKHAAACRRLTLRVATQTGVSKLLRFAAREPLSKLFAAFQQHAVCVGWMPEGAQPSFWFDGERLGEDVTAEGAELEDDFVIDCKW